MTDLETRMALVEQSYKSLETRIEKVEEKLDNMRDELINSNHGLIKVIVGAAGTIVAGLLSTIVVILMSM